MAWFAIAAWSGVSVGARVAFSGLASAWAAVGVGVAVVALIAWRARKGRASIAAMVALGIAAGAAAGALWGVGTQGDSAAVVSAGFREWRGVVATDPRQAGNSYLVQVRLEHDAGGGLIDVWWPEDVGPPRMGQRVEFRASLGVPEDSGARRRAYFSGVCARASATSASVLGWPRTANGQVLRFRAHLCGELERAHSPGSAVLCAMLVGYREPLRGSPEEADFRATGTSHLLAVSGTHIAIVSGFIGSIARALRMRRGSATVLIVGFAVLQCGMCGLQASAVRACGMAVVAGVAALGARRVDTLASLSGCLAAIVLLAPGQAFLLGLRLSACAVLGIALFGRLAEAWIGTGMPRRCARLAGPLSIALVAQAATLPVSVPVWQTVPLVSPLANLIAVPLASCALVLGVVGAATGLVFTPLGAWMWRCAGWTIAAASATLSRLACLPSATVLVGASAAAAGVTFVAIAAGLWMWWPGRPSRRVSRIGGLASACAVAMLVATGFWPRGPSIVFMDVGQGDAILVRDGGRAMLVDCGPESDALRQALARAGVRHLDAVVLTHDHADHTGGAKGLRGIVRVGTVFGTGGERSVRARDIDPDALDRELSAGDSLTVGSFSVEVLWPPDAREENDAALPDENSRSTVLLLKREGVSVLLTGDAEEPVWTTLAESGELPDCDVLKVPHHGSANGVSPENMAEMSPRVAIISVGTGNEFGHPSGSTVGELESAGARVVRTDTAGDITIRFRARSFALSVSRRGQSASAYETIHRARGRYAVIPDRRDARHTSWARATCRISSRSTSYTVPKSTCWTRRSIVSRPGSPRSPTWCTT